MRIVPLLPKYASRLARIERQSLDAPWTCEAIAALCGNAMAVAAVALEDGAAVGYYSFYNIDGEGDINNVVVDADFRRRGLGAALMQDMLARAEALGIDAMTLEVREDNIAAVRLYEKAGFKTEGRRPKYYGDKAALIMWRRN